MTQDKISEWKWSQTLQEIVTVRQLKNELFFYFIRPANVPKKYDRLRVSTSLKWMAEPFNLN